MQPMDVEAYRGAPAPERRGLRGALARLSTAQRAAAGAGALVALALLATGGSPFGSRVHDPSGMQLPGGAAAALRATRPGGNSSLAPLNLAGSGPGGAPRHVFIDVGGNVGDSLAAFLSVGVPGMTGEGSGHPPPAEWDAVFVFEPNPDFADRYERYRGKAYDLTFLPAAAAGEDGTMTFEGGGLGGAVDGLAGVGTGGGGGRALQQQLRRADGAAAAAAAPAARRATTTAGVRVYDFSAWLRSTVGLADTVVCKIDAEGAEFDFVRRMMAHGTLCLCDRLSIEWHGWYGTPREPQMKSVQLPATTYGSSPSAPECAGRSDCFCHIPHMARRLPFHYCGLPQTLLWARQACVGVGGIDGSNPLLEHHEVWWPDVGTDRAFVSYPETG